MSDKILNGTITGFAQFYVSPSNRDFEKLVEEGAAPITPSAFSEPQYPTGRLATFIIAMEKNPYNTTINVNSGFTDEQRIDFWNRRKDLVGKSIKFTLDKELNGVFVSL